MSERRRSTRSRCLVGALVTFNNAKSSLSCVARNITADGCMLVFGEDPLIPGRIDIQLSNRKDIVPAHVVWRSGLKVGVAFETALSQSGLRVEAAQHLNGLLAERATLRFH